KEILITDEIIRQHTPMISSLCHRMIFDDDAAEDTAQEIWIEIIRSSRTFRGESSLSTWIYSIARNVISEHVKKEISYSTRHLRGYFHGPEQEFPAGINVEDEVEKEIWTREKCYQCLTAILHCLNNDSRLAYLLRDQIKLSYAEISLIMHTSEENIRKNISRSRKKITSFLKNECYLFNTNGKCRCRMITHVKKYNLRSEYEKIRQMGEEINVVKLFNLVLPDKNDLKKFI
ncbi:MAG TPA: sigma-70 family RNA polymerase sigma factor, partial [Spirochaetota bacterium]